MNGASPAKSFDASLCVPVSFVDDIGIYGAELRYYWEKMRITSSEVGGVKRYGKNGKHAFQFFILLIQYYEGGDTTIFQVVDW